MLRIAIVSIFIVLFGQFGFIAVTYYLGLTNPSIPFWAIIYGVLAIIGALRAKSAKVSIIDVLLFVCFGWVVLSYSIYGESERGEFTYRVLLFVIGPYICGRVFGNYLSLGHFRILFGIATIYLLILAAEVARNPADFLGIDRVRLFVPEGSSPVGFYLGTTFGAALTVAVTFLKMGVPQTEKSRMLHILIAGASFAVLVLWGSRGSLLAVLAVGAIAFLGRVKLSSVRTYGVLLALAVVVLSGSFMLTGARREFIEQIPAAITAFRESGACIVDGDSVLAHITLLNEAWRLFLQAPLFGIGASNYGLYYCGIRTDLASPHSTAVHILVEFGLAGFMVWAAAFVAIVLKFIQFGTSADGERHALASTLFFLWLFLIFALQTGGNLYYDYHLYLITGWLVASLRNRSALHSDSEPLATSPGRASTVP